MLACNNGRLQSEIKISFITYVFIEIKNYNKNFQK